MTPERAKEILLLHRPGTDDATEPEVAEALALAERDAELGRWWEQQRALQAALREKFKQIRAPNELKQLILSGPRPRGKVIWLTTPILWAAAAAFILLITFLAFRSSPQTGNRFAAYRNRMVRTAMRNYSMNLVTNDLNQIRQYLAKNQGHSDYALTRALEALPGDGCAVLRWHQRTVSLVCFDLGNRTDLYLFIIRRSDLTDPPPAGPPAFNKIGTLMTASWSSSDKTYILAGPGDEVFLRKFL